MTVARRLIASLAAAALVLGAACGSEQAEAGVATDEVEQIELESVPSELLGLEVAREDMAEALSGTDRTYLDGIALYSLRQDQLVKATLQVNRFSEDAEYGTSDFQRAIVNQIGGRRAQTVRLGDQNVFLTTGTKQRISVWFEGRYGFVLAVRDDFPQPKTLLREALEVQP